jgi:hypothetical protein
MSRIHLLNNTFAFLSAVFQSVDCSVKAVQNEGLYVKLTGYKSKAYLPKVHLSDLATLSDLMARALAKKDVLSEVVTESERACEQQTYCQTSCCC